jgi:hypothetical protein
VGDHAHSLLIHFHPRRKSPGYADECSVSVSRAHEDVAGDKGVEASNLLQGFTGMEKLGHDLRWPEGRHLLILFLLELLF